VYTLRFALQPVDGNHLVASPTRDFLLLVRASDDTSAELMEEKPLMELSAEAAASNHPGTLCLRPVQGGSDEIPSLRHNEDDDWWLLRATGKAKAGRQTRDLVLDLVVVGHADE
jgi:hypothetical protein